MCSQEAGTRSYYPNHRYGPNCIDTAPQANRQRCFPELDKEVEFISTNFWRGAALWIFFQKKKLQKSYNLSYVNGWIKFNIPIVSGTHLTYSGEYYLGSKPFALLSLSIVKMGRNLTFYIPYYLGSKPVRYSPTGPNT